MNSRRGLKWIVLIAGLGVLVIIFGIKMFMGYEEAQALAHRAAFSVTVHAAPVTIVHWRRHLHAIANLEANQGVELTPQVSGWVTRIYFHSGDHVRTGQPIVQLDPSNEEAVLAHDRAIEVVDHLDLVRARKLYRIRATSLASLQAAQSAYEAARAQVADDLATLDKLRVSAPFTGWLGVRQVSLGQYLGPTTVIATLQSWNPLRVIFTLPQQDLPYLKTGETVDVRVNAYPQRIFSGRIVALSSRVDPSTRNITVEGSLNNSEHILRPGMYATIVLPVGKSQRWLAVPTSAITYSTFGDYVYLVIKKQVGKTTLQLAIAHPVIVGPQRNGLTAIRQGLQPGELVVTAGQVKLHSGFPVTIVPSAHNPATPQRVTALTHPR